MSSLHLDPKTKKKSLKGVKRGNTSRQNRSPAAAAVRLSFYVPSISYTYVPYNFFHGVGYFFKGMCRNLSTFLAVIPYDMVPVWYFSVQLKEAEDDVLKDLQAQQLELQQRNMNERYSRFTIKRPRQHDKQILKNAETEGMPGFDPPRASDSWA